jgi:hypothetical protein
MIVSAKSTMSGTPAEKFIGLLVSIYSKQGGFTASTCDGYVSSSNTIDFYGTASTIDIEVSGRVSMAETEINVEDPNVVFQSVGRTASSTANEMITDTVTHVDIYQYDEAKGKPRSMIDTNFPDLHDRAYGSEINIKSHNGDFPPQLADFLRRDRQRRDRYRGAFRDEGHHQRQHHRAARYRLDLQSL